MEAHAAPGTCDGSLLFLCIHATQCCVGCCLFLSHWHNPAWIMYFTFPSSPGQISTVRHLWIQYWWTLSCGSRSGRSEFTWCSNLGLALCARCSAAAWPARPGLAHAAAQLFCIWDAVSKSLFRLWFTRVALGKSEYHLIIGIWLHLKLWNSSWKQWLWQALFESVEILRYSKKDFFLV